MDTPIDPIDEQIMAIAMLVGEPAHDDATDEPRSLPGRGIDNQAIGGRALDLSCGEFSLHRADDIHALAHGFGSASCGARGCQYGSISVGAVSLKTTRKH